MEAPERSVDELMKAQAVREAQGAGHEVHYPPYTSEPNQGLPPSEAPPSPDQPS